VITLQSEVNTSWCRYASDVTFL